SESSASRINWTLFGGLSRWWSFRSRTPRSFRRRSGTAIAARGASQVKSDLSHDPNRLATSQSSEQSERSTLNVILVAGLKGAAFAKVRTVGIDQGQPLITAHKLRQAKFDDIVVRVDNEK